ncbi:MAG: cell division protein ZapD [Burkholderiaceae bacterium]|nr:cell division protein ZapD [Burkholderiaceae bacterium]
MSAGSAPTLLYEYPFNERVRTLLRLEDLFDRIGYFRAQEHPYSHHAALMTLFEILEMTARADLKGELLQELERQKQGLLALRNNPQVSETALSAVLADIDRAQQGLAAVPGKAGQSLRDNEWLTSIRSRAGIPGGTCEFDLPSYHAWLMRDAPARTADLDSWLRTLAPFSDAMVIVLRLLRETAHRSQQVAVQGAYQQMLQGRTYALLQVRVALESGAIPEISANKYALWIRFTTADRDFKPRALERDVPFELALCAF